MIKDPKPMHPDVARNEVYMKKVGLNSSQIKEKCNCSLHKNNEIVNGKRFISPEFAMAFQQPLGTTTELPRPNTSMGSITFFSKYAKVWIKPC